MKKILIVIIIVIALLVGYWLLSPLFIDKKVQEGLEEISEQIEKNSPSDSQDTLIPQGPENLMVISEGAFEGKGAHSAKGTARIISSGEKKFVRFEDDFEVTNGPDLFVYLGRNGAYDPETQLGALKGNIGSQNYDIPGRFDLSQYDSVWVWCRAFSVAFGEAKLNSVQ